jgi:predicted nucleotidyltransferase
MMPEKFRKALEDVQRFLQAKRVVISAILFGSVARDEAVEDSDLDLLLILTDPKEERRIYRQLQGLGANHDVRINVLCVDESLSQLDRQMIESILRHGRPLKGDIPRVTLQDLKLRPLRLVRYSLKGMSQAEKARLNRVLSGYESRKKVGEKTYIYREKGLIEELGGVRIGPGALLVPEESAAKVEEVLRRHGAKRVLIPIWASEP